MGMPTSSIFVLNAERFQHCYAFLFRIYSQGRRCIACFLSVGRQFGPLGVTESKSAGGAHDRDAASFGVERP